MPFSSPNCYKCRIPNLAMKARCLGDVAGLAWPSIAVGVLHCCVQLQVESRLPAWSLGTAFNATKPPAAHSIIEVYSTASYSQSTCVPSVPQDHCIHLLVYLPPTRRVSGTCREGLDGSCLGDGGQARPVAGGYATVYLFLLCRAVCGPSCAVCPLSLHSSE